mmetsp:Transcript_82960/g.235350  ORF Transcript_82960/g.235350 Transcript_82960/m.235350 type:complete len:318 (+) Transcript_82960:2145-3098(+)
MAKSAAFTACWPSYPKTPTPTWASWIIGTSLAPSPMASVTGAGLIPSHTMRTMSAFCAGEIRQAITTAHFWAMSRNAPLRLASECTALKAPPVTISATVFLSRTRSSTFFLTALKLVPATSTSRCLWSEGVVGLLSGVRPPAGVERSGHQSRTSTCISSVSTPLLKPMLRAVSSLSPVSTQSLMPAFRMLSTAAGTPSCSLSSMAEAPTTSRPLSISTAASVRAPLRFATLRSAASYLRSQSSFSLGWRRRRAKTSVRRPWRENSPRWSCSASWPLAAQSRIALSAPLARTWNWPSCSTTTDMRFRVESNAFTARIV